MEITVRGRHLEITPAIREYAAGKCARLPRFFDRLRTVEVVASKSEHSHYGAEMIVQADRTEPFVATESGTDLYACIDRAVDKLGRQLAEYKARVRNHKGRTPMSG